MCTLLTVSVASDFLFRHWLVKEPVAHNPLRLILQLRTSTPYWDDRHNSRLDLAKVKYGGPFTTKQVEDVKAFFQNLMFIGMGCLFLAISLYLGSYVYANASKFTGFHTVMWTEGMREESGYRQLRTHLNFAQLPGPT